jgi:hypothetical protein
VRARDKLNLDIFWIRDGRERIQLIYPISMCRPPRSSRTGVALEQFGEIAQDLEE